MYFRCRGTQTLPELKTFWQEGGKSMDICTGDSTTFPKTSTTASRPARKRSNYKICRSASAFSSNLSFPSLEGTQSNLAELAILQ